MKNNQLKQQRAHEQPVNNEASKKYTSEETEFVTSTRAKGSPPKTHIRKNSFGAGISRLNKLEIAIALDKREQYKTYKVKIDPEKERKPRQQ